MRALAFKQTLLAAAGVVLLGVALTSFFVWNQGNPDVKAYWEAAVRLRAGEPIYVAPAPSPSPKWFLYPPAFAALFAPLTLLTPLWGYAVWQALHAVFLAWSLRSAALLSGVEQRERVVAWLLVSIAVTFAAIAGELQEGQANLLALGLSLQGLVWSERGRPLAGGLLLATAAHVKLYPIALAALLVAWRRWRALRGLGVGLAVLALAPVAWRAPRAGLADAISYTVSTYAEFVRQILLPGVSERVVAGDVQFYVLNNSLTAVLHRLFSDSPFSPFPWLASWRGPLLVALPSGFLTAFATLGGAALICATLVRAGRLATSAPARLLAAGMLYVAVQITTPTCWEHHLVWLLAIVAPLCAHAAVDRSARASLGAVIGLWLAVLTVPLVLQIGLQAGGSTASIGWLVTSRAWGAPTLAILVTWAVGYRRLAALSSPALEAATAPRAGSS